MTKKKKPPPAQLTDTERLNVLSAAGGFLRGTDGGLPAYRILGTDEWYPDLRQAVDAKALVAAPQKRP